MAITKLEIIVSAIIVLSLVVLLIIDGITPVSYDEDGNSSYPVSLYLTMTLVETFICFVIGCLHFRRAPTLKWKILILGGFLCSAGSIHSLCLLPNPPGLDFEFSMIFGIDTVGFVIFLLPIFISDKKITSAFALFVSSVVLLYTKLDGVFEQKFTSIFLCTLSLLIYLLLLLIWVKHSSNHWWMIAVITLIFTSAIIVIVHFLGIRSRILFFFITSIDACSTLLVGLWMYAQNARHPETSRDDQYNFLEIAGLPTRFTINELETATSNFQTPIGEGGSGAVFKGTLNDGSVIAVKRIKGQANGDEFRTEITTIASLQHMSLVRLVGFCLSPGGDRYLIYPFFTNGSLDAWLFHDKEKRACLTWTYRYRIAVDVAKALAYLHHECHQQVLHLDIKPANILLDSSFRALVSDFGISKSIGKDESSVMTRARGTVGYLPPEMLVPNAISTKSDVYSYGMVLLELVGGRRNFMTLFDLESQETHKSFFPKIVKEKMMEGKLMEAVDPCLQHEEIKEEVMILVQVALWCIQENPALRPSTTEIVDMLERQMPVSMPPESPMFVVNLLDYGTQASTSNQPEDVEAARFSSDTISISIQSGR